MYAWIYIIRSLKVTKRVDTYIKIHIERHEKPHAHEHIHTCTYIYGHIDIHTDTHTDTHVNTYKRKHTHTYPYFPHPLHIHTSMPRTLAYPYPQTYPHALTYIGYWKYTERVESSRIFYQLECALAMSRSDGKSAVLSLKYINAAHTLIYLFSFARSRRRERG